MIRSGLNGFFERVLSVLAEFISQISAESSMPAYKKPSDNHLCFRLLGLFITRCVIDEGGTFMVTISLYVSILSLVVSAISLGIVLADRKK